MRMQERQEQRSAASSDGAGSEIGLAALPPLDLTSERAAVSSAARPDSLLGAEPDVSCVPLIYTLSALHQHCCYACRKTGR